MDSKDVDLDDKQPSVSSSDPNERKLARQLRIKRRLENAEMLTLIAEKKYVEPEHKNTLLEETIETSEDTLRQLYIEGNELVTNIQVASDSIEVNRRETEAEERNLRMQQLKEEAASALEKLEEISTKWEAIVETSGPLELHQHLKDQKAKCLELIEQKNNLIKSFQLELKIADEKFMKGRKNMYEELSLLTRRIDEQVLLMKQAYRIELKNIEESIDVTRTQLIEKHSKNWQYLYNQREREEVTNMNRKLVMVDKFHEELYKLHRDHQEKYRETKIALENDIQVLEQELEQVKALCLLNSEKLDYNYQVLKKREEENVYIKNHQKRRLNKLQDLVNTLKKKIDDKRLSTEDEVKKLTREVERYHANVLDTEKKADHMSQVNEKKFQDIWDMKDEEAKDLVDKIVAVNKVVFEQILGLPWTQPPYPALNKRNLPSYKTAQAVVKSIHKGETGGKHVNAHEHGDGNVPPEIFAGRKRLLRHILEMIADQSGFLMEEKLDELLRPYTDDEKTFVRLDNVCAAIEIRTEADLEVMKDIFKPFTICLLCDKQNASLLSIDVKDELLDIYFKGPAENKQASVLQIRELEEKVSKLRVQSRGREERDSFQSESEKGSEKRDFQSDGDRERVADDSAMGIAEASAVTAAGPGSLIPGLQPPVKNSETSKPENVCDLSHPLIIEKYHVLKALKIFVAHYHRDKCGTLTGMQTRLTKKRYTISRILSREDICSYWEGYKNLLPTSIENKWNAVFLALIRYLAILQERHELNLRAQKLQRQNSELRRLLMFYKSGKYTDDFVLPHISSVPDGPIDPEEIAQIVNNLSY